MTPTNRKELIEVMARAIDPDRIELSPGHADCDICQDARKTLLESAEAALTALEQSGCEVVPKVATDDMAAKIEAAIMENSVIIDYGTVFGCDLEISDNAGQQIWTAMFSANPFKQQDV